MNLLNTRNNVQSVQGNVQGAVQGEHVENTGLFKVDKVFMIFLYNINYIVTLY